MRSIDWEKHRRPDGTIDLSSAFKDAVASNTTLPFPEEAGNYFSRLELLQPVKSRQIAALALMEAEKRCIEGVK